MYCNTDPVLYMQYQLFTSTSKVILTFLSTLTSYTEPIRAFSHTFTVTLLCTDGEQFAAITCYILTYHTAQFVSCLQPTMGSNFHIIIEVDQFRLSKFNHISAAGISYVSFWQQPDSLFTEMLQ